jgi:hypothetical protein
MHSKKPKEKILGAMVSLALRHYSSAHRGSQTGKQRFIIIPRLKDQELANFNKNTTKVLLL